MVKTTKEQRKAILRLAIRSGGDYRALRKAACPTIGCDNAIVLHWCNMWLCIETDGYTHS